MANYKPYPQYKNSGIPWLGEVPEHWEVRKLKHLFQIQKRIAGELGYDVLSITQNGIKVKDITSGAGQLAMDYSKYQRIYIGEFGMNHMDLLTGYVDISKFDGVISPDYRVFSKIDYNSDKSYLLKLLQLCYKQKIFYAEGQGAAQLGRWRMPSDNFKNFQFPIPPKEEQTTIARFLDYKLAKINRFIRKKKQLIQLLNEQKAAIINQAVTKGLDPNAKMKDSSIEWLGEIPEHWEVRKLKYVADVVLGKMLCNEDKGGYFKKPYLKSKNIQWLNVDISDVEEMWFSASELEMYKLKKGDLVLSEGGEVGKTCMWNEELEECFIQNSAHKVSIKSENSNTYFLYLFNAYGKKGGFDSIVNRVSIAHLTKDKLINIKCVVPPLFEQQQIVTHIETETALLTTTISKIEKEIALVEEYKTALIAEAVTGKIDVRGYEVPEMESETEGYEELEEELSMVAEDAAEYQTEAAE